MESKIILVIDFQQHEKREKFDPSLVMSLVALLSKSSFPGLIEKLFLINLLDYELKLTKSYVARIFKSKIDRSIFCLGDHYTDANFLSEKARSDILLKFVKLETLDKSSFSKNRHGETEIPENGSL